MTDDLVKRLRGEECERCVNSFCTCDVIEQAANCIEQLEAVLRKIACVCWPNPGCTRGEKCKEFIARAALEGKND